MNSFLRALEVQRWDDHRYYHHSRINQSLHFVSAVSFLCAYALLFTDPAAAALRLATSSSSRRATTKSTAPPTSTRSRSRSVTT